MRKLGSSYLGLSLLLLFACLSPSLGNDDENISFQWSKSHRKELRDVHVTWDTLEIGAPIFSPLGEYSQDALAALQIAVQFGELPLGSYRYEKVRNSELENSPLYVDSLSGAIDFQFTREHQILIKHLSVELCESWESGEEVPGVDAKRPYGDFTYYQLEMAKHLELPTTLNEEGYREIDQATEQRLTELHHQMQVALQVYLQNFTIEAGTFRGDPYFGNWERL